MIIVLLLLTPIFIGALLALYFDYEERKNDKNFL
jgi:hypothetical protein